MVEWILVPCLVQLREDFNALAPNRDKASDGSIGDTAHQGTSSDHNPDETGTVPIRDADKVNEVHAIDVDADLKVSGVSMEDVVQFLLARCRAGTEKRLRYIIFNRRIWSASSGWAPEAYRGSNPHDKHAHFSASYDAKREADRASWHLEDIMGLTGEEADKFIFGRDIIPNPRQRPDGATNPKTTFSYAVGDTWAQVYNLRDQLTALGTALKAAIAALAARDWVDEVALAEAIKPGLAAAVVAALPADRDDVSQEELVAALESVLAEAFGRTS